MFYVSTGIQKDPPRSCHPSIAFRGAIKKEGKGILLPEPTLEVFAGYAYLPWEGFESCGRTANGDFGLKEAPFFEEYFAPREERFRNEFLDGEADVVGRKFFNYHPYGFGCYIGGNGFLLFEYGTVPC